MLWFTVWRKDGVKDRCSGNFVIFAEKYLWESLLKEDRLVEFQFILNEVLCQIWFFKNSKKYSMWLTVQIWAAKYY